MSKYPLYISTALHLKPSQIVYRVLRRLGGITRLRIGYNPKPKLDAANILNVPVLPELDFDPVFLSRFDIDAILDNRIKLLHHEEAVDWRLSWHMPISTPLWRFNFHYCEYLLPLAKAYIDTDDDRYLKKGKEIIASWIDCCPCAKGGAAWDPYVISMRVVNWLAFYGELREALERDDVFIERFNRSLIDQFQFLSCHLERDLLANHYLENLKALVILSCYFSDEMTLSLALPKLYSQVEEQVLPDGMHFELSPMYHKIVLEDLLRVAICLIARGMDVSRIVNRLHLQSMSDCLWTLERNTNRTPLFNDSGDNVAKSRDALLCCAKNRLDIEASYRGCLPDAGYVILERSTDQGLVKLIFDVGNPGPPYAMGHSHCDALSFECFIDGRPWIVNSGTYAYQDEHRLKFKQTLSHNAIKVDGAEQHECWAPFRVGGYSRAQLVSYDALSAKGEVMQRGSGAVAKRSICLEADGIVVNDEIEPGHLISEAFISALTALDIEGQSDQIEYAPEFGRIQSVWRIVTAKHSDPKTVVIPYPYFETRPEPS